EVIAITPPKIFSKEVAQKQATPFLRQDLLTARNRFRPNFRGWRLDENLKLKSPPYRGADYKGSAARQNEVGLAAGAAAACRAPAPALPSCIAIAMRSMEALLPLRLCKKVYGRESLDRGRQNLGGGLTGLPIVQSGQVPSAFIERGVGEVVRHQAPAKPQLEATDAEIKDKTVRADSGVPDFIFYHVEFADRECVDSARGAPRSAMRSASAVAFALSLRGQARLQSVRIIGARLGSPISRCQTGRARADRPGRPGGNAALIPICSL